MKSNSVLKILNPILAILLLIQCLTGILHDSIPHEVFAILHQGGGIALAIAAVLHLILNWKWVAASFFRKNPAGQP